MTGGREHESLWTPANVVTLIRICLVPLFMVVILAPWPDWVPTWTSAQTWKPWISGLAFVMIAATDSVDGYLARSRNEVTTMGKFLDPLADKILVAAALLALIELKVLPSWPALVILAREFIVSGIRMVAASKGLVIAASWYGKAKTVMQIVAIVLFIVKDSLLIEHVNPHLDGILYVASWAAMSIALILTIASMLDYFVKAREVLGFPEKPASVGRYASEPAGHQSIDDETRALIEPAALESLACQVLERAREAHMTLGTAESCTGGLIAGALTAIPGSSDVIEGGIVSYSGDVKMGVLGVKRLTIKRHGQVSEETACEMAAGARRVLDVGAAVAVTGVAGPGGGSKDKPVGTVWFGVSDSHITFAEVRHFAGTREQVRLQTVRCALELLDAAIESHTHVDDL